MQSYFGNGLISPSMPSSTTPIAVAPNLFLLSTYFYAYLTIFIELGMLKFFKSEPKFFRQLLKSYISATGGALATALTLNHVAKVSQFYFDSKPPRNYLNKFYGVQLFNITEVISRSWQISSIRCCCCCQLYQYSSHEI